MSIIKYIQSNPGVIWSGFGIFALTLIGSTIVFFITHIIITKTEYNRLIKISYNYIDVDELKKGLEFNNDFSIYIENKSNEKFCPTCLTNNGKKNHLKKDISEYGTRYFCPVCKEVFEGKEYRQNLDQALMDSENRY